VQPAPKEPIAEEQLNDDVRWEGNGRIDLDL